VHGPTSGSIALPPEKPVRSANNSPFTNQAAGFRPYAPVRLSGIRKSQWFAASRAKNPWIGGIPPLGYDARDRKLAVNPAEAELVRLIFRRFLDLGSALLLIREINDPAAS
jgi:hypothetical protein